jgi:hypothetical protein
MIIVKLDGGMGNQLFQYAIGKYLALRFDTTLRLDTHVFNAENKRRYALHHFNVEEVFSTARERKNLKRKEFFRRQLNRLGTSIKPYWYTEQSPGYDVNVAKLTDNVYLEGFWQSEKYFKPIEDTIRKEFTVKDQPSALNRKYLDEIRSANSVSIHVRRGDYVTEKETNAIHGVCDLEYYRKAIGRMSVEVSDPRFYIFSDDINWTKANLPGSTHPSVYIDHNQTAPHEDLRLMYFCKHHIIANSSFSWWGAWLNVNAEKKVIAPRNWFRTLENKDIIPNGWLTL